MKTRHLAALALMGWYLIVPPTTRIWWVGPQRTDNAAQLSQWTIQQSFDKSGTCETARLATQQQSANVTGHIGNALCVASDDPRLTPRI
jgi:hypothetical protein